MHPLGVALFLTVLPWTSRAHNPDTSYARVTITTNSVEFRFTYDIVTLLKVTPLDSDQDNRVTQAEIEAGASAIHQYLRSHVLVEIQSRITDLGEAQPPTWPEDGGEAILKEDYHQRLIQFTFLKAWKGRPDDVVLIFDFFEDFGDRHTVLGVFVHGKREDPVIFTQFEPDYLYDLRYALAAESPQQPSAMSPPVPSPDPPDPSTTAEPTINSNTPPGVVETQANPRPMRRSEQETSSTGVAGRFLHLGMEHIFEGYDHLLFLLGLIVIGRFWDLLKVVTSFTVAHTITLILAALQLVSLPSRWVETAIAITIVYVATENLCRKEPRHRWALTFGFGLIHGFGFANVLRGLELPTSGFVTCLISFNVGVELGQLIVVLMLWPLIAWSQRQPWSRRAQQGVSSIILVIGTAWFLDRALALGWMPF